MTLLYFLALAQLLLLLPQADAAGGPVATISGQCAWRICLIVTVHRPPSGHRDSSGSDDDESVAADVRSLVMHRCLRSHDHPAQCFLSETASNLDGVRNFTMRRAELATVPLADFCRYPRLSLLDLAENAVTEFAYPVGLPPGCLARLRWLNLRANDLRQADLSQFMRLPGLEELDLSENPRLESLYMSQQPPQSGVALKVIRAAKCRIKLVDISLVRLPSLQDLDLSFNRVTRITNRLKWNWTLEEVSKIVDQRNSRRATDPHYYVRLSIQLVQNQIGPEAFDAHSLWGLPVKDLASDRPDKVVKELSRYQNAFLPFLYIDNFGSTITCDCHLLHAWSYLRLVRWDPSEFNKRNALYLDYWMRLPCEPAGPSPMRLGKLTLTSLTVQDLTCPHVDDCPAGCTCLEEVSPSQLVVDCRGAGLTAMPARLPVSVHPVRYILLLADNRIRTLTAPPNASLVQVLDLSGNRITEAADFSPLAAFAYLHSLNLTGNPLRRIPPSLLDLGRRSVRPSVHLGPGGVLCDCDLFESDAWKWLRRLFPDLRCLLGQADSGAAQPLAQLVDYRHRHCARRVNTTSIVYRERHVFGQPVVLWVGVGLFLLTLVAAVLAILQFRRPPPEAAGGRDKGATPLPPISQLPKPPPPPLQLTAAGGCSVGGEGGSVFSLGCISPDYLPPGYSPYEMPRYAPPRGRVDCADRSQATLVFLRGAACDGGSGDGGAGGASWTRTMNCRSASSSSSSSSGGGDDYVGGAGEGDNDLVATGRCAHHPGHSHGPSQGHCHGRGHRHGSHSLRHSRQRSGGDGRQAMGRLLERELLLPPPLPPRPTSSGLGSAGAMTAARVTDV